MKEILKSFQSSAVQTDLYGFTVAILLSLLSAAIIAALYWFFFENRRGGAQVHRFFLIGGPSVTVMLLAIQFSLPLSLGLLGALSFVRFRTPVKEPEEVAYIMLLIASSISCATFNFILVGILLLVSIMAILIQRSIKKAPFRKRKDGMLVLAFLEPQLEKSEYKIATTIENLLKNSKLESLSSSEELLTYHYSFETSMAIDTDKIISSINKKLNPEKIHFFWGEL